MDNLKRPAYPLPIATQSNGEVIDTTDYAKQNGGFTKHELASLMIAQGAAEEIGGVELNERWIARFSANCAIIAKAVLEQANQ